MYPWHLGVVPVFDGAQNLRAIHYRVFHQLDDDPLIKFHMGGGTGYRSHDIQHCLGSIFDTISTVQLKNCLELPTHPR